MDQANFTITAYRANSCGNSQNCLYPYEESASTEEDLQRLFARDHTFIRFLDNHRNRDDFHCAKYAVFDCDNDHSENAENWITSEKIQELFPNVQCCIYTSRNNNKQKGAKSARPRFHVIFPIDPITAVDFYTAFMRKIQVQYPFFDKNALDGGRFFYGNPETQVQFLSGTINLTQFISEKESAQAFAELGLTIPVLGKQFLLGICHGCQQFFLIPTDQLEQFLVFLTGRLIIFRWFDVTIPEFFQNIHNTTLLKSVCDVTSAAHELQVAKLHKLGRLFLSLSAV